ncbi:MAG TPA: hypothetical protein DCY35_11905 [Prolixibacteraceae bacterium]|nr:hypothetical protein [Prolixibacteraceae bacterium]
MSILTSLLVAIAVCLDSFAVAIISILTIVMVTLGILIGKRKGQLPGDRMEILGGVILILIGISFLVINWWL